MSNFCSSCGFRRDAVSRFCPNCGTRFIEESTPIRQNTASPKITPEGRTAFILGSIAISLAVLSIFIVPAIPGFVLSIIGIIDCVRKRKKCHDSSLTTAFVLNVIALVTCVVFLLAVLAVIFFLRGMLVLRGLS